MQTEAEADRRENARPSEEPKGVPVFFVGDGQRRIGEIRERAGKTPGQTALFHFPEQGLGRHSVELGQGKEV